MLEPSPVFSGTSGLTDVQTRHLDASTFCELLVSHRELERLDDDQFLGLFDPALGIRYVIDPDELHR